MTVLMLKLSFRHPLRAGMLSVSAFGIPMLLLGLRPGLWPLMAASFVAGLGVEVFGVGWSTALHEHIPLSGSIRNLESAAADVTRAGGEERPTGVTQEATVAGQ